MNMHELLPCPFCGGKAYLNIDEDKDPLVRGNGENLIYSVLCGKCGASTKLHWTSIEAFKSWNRRISVKDKYKVYG